MNKYQAFVSSVDAGSLTKAADELNITQSAVSHSIAALEEELGFPVIIRNKGGVKLTSEGKKILPEIRKILKSIEQMNQTASSIRGLESGTVRIGAFTSVAVHWLPAILKAFQADYPNVEIKMLNGDYHDTEQWLKDGSVDLGFISVPTKFEGEVITLYEDPLLAILPEDSKYASYPKFPVSECATEPFISILESSDHDARQALSKANVKPNVRFYTKDDYAVIAMVEQGLGMSIMPELLLKDRSDKLIALPLQPESKRTIGLAIASSGPATRRFAQYVIDYVKSSCQ